MFARTYDIDGMTVENFIRAETLLLDKHILRCLGVKLFGCVKASLETVVELGYNLKFVK